VIEGQAEKRLRDTTIIRKPIIVPETNTASAVLQEMRKKQIHMAIIEDEYGGTSGIVSLDDIIEGLVGEIRDEFDNPVPKILKETNGIYIIDGLTPIEKFQKKFNLSLKKTTPNSTIAGTVFSLLGHEPKKGDIAKIENLKLEVLEMDHNRIKSLRVTLKK
jgi:CBS domain containing-hemolysin-like protein